MNSLKFLFISLSLLCAFSNIECVLETQILAFLEAFRVRMCHPIPNLGLPAIDPLQITHRELALDNKYLVDFTGSIDDFRLTGISDFVVNKLNIVTGIRSTIDVTFPFTALKSIYTAKGSLAYILNMAGDGNAESNADGFRIKLTFIIKIGLKLGIRSLRLDFTLNGIHIDFENLLEEERVNIFFHDLVNELGVELLNDIWKPEQATVEQFLEDKINSFIGQYSYSDIINIIAGGGGGGPPIFEGVPGDCKNQQPTASPI